MSELKKIKEGIHGRYQSLSQNQKKLADFLIENYDHIPFYSVQNIAEATSMSVASVVRLSQRLGFKGFLEMRSEVSKELQEQIKNNTVFSLIDDETLRDDTLTEVANHDIKNISDTLNLIDRNSFNKAVKLILDSDRVFTIGLGISYLLSEILAYQLKQVAVDAYNFTHNHTTFMEQVPFLNKKDLIIAFSFPPYSKETIDTAAYADKKNVKVVSITNKIAAPISFSSDVSLIVRSKNFLFTNSFAAVSVLINAITTECARLSKNRTKKFLNELNNIVDQQNLVIQESSSKKNSRGHK
jgi:DNA-binding MurR/RpiR family transcriptional regulator